MGKEYHSKVDAEVDKMKKVADSSMKKVANSVKETGSEKSTFFNGLRKTLR